MIRFIIPKSSCDVCYCLSRALFVPVAERQKKKRLCRTRWMFYTEVAVLHGRDFFRRWWRFYTAVLQVAMAVSYAKGRSIRFCTRPSSAKIVLSSKGQSVRFCSEQTSDEFLLFMKGQRSRFGTPRSKFLLWLGLEFIMILNTLVLFKNYG